MQHSMGNTLIVIGACLIIGGLVAKLGLLSWLGHLPGDFHVKQENFQFYLPLTSMLIVSATLSALFSIVRRFL